MTFEDYDDMVEGLRTLFETYSSTSSVPLDELEWNVAQIGVDTLQWILDDLHIILDWARNKVVLYAPSSVGAEYTEAKVNLLLKTIQRLGGYDG